MKKLLLVLFLALLMLPTVAAAQCASLPEFVVNHESEECAYFNSDCVLLLPDGWIRTGYSQEGIRESNSERYYRTQCETSYPGYTYRHVNVGEASLTQEYWWVLALVIAGISAGVTALLAHYRKKQLKKFDHFKHEEQSRSPFLMKLIGKPSSLITFSLLLYLVTYYVMGYLISGILDEPFFGNTAWNSLDNITIIVKVTGELLLGIGFIILAYSFFHRPKKERILLQFSALLFIMCCVLLYIIFFNVAPLMS